MKNLRSPLFALLVAVSIGLSAHAGYGADGAAGKKKEIQRIKREMREKKQGIRKADRKERSILTDLEKLDKAILTGSTELSGQEKQLRGAESELKNIEKDYAEIHQGLGREKQIYRERIRALYKMGRSGYAASVLSSDSFTAALKRIKYLGVIAEHDQGVIQGYRSSLDVLTERQTEIAKRKEDILRRKRLVGAKKTELESQKRKKSAVLANVRREKGAYEQALRELEESSENLWAMIKKAEQEKKAARTAALPARTRTPPPAAYTEGRGRLPWPTNGEVVTRFGVQRHPQFGTVVFRRGIEIQARPGEDIRAVDDGIVKFADWYKGYGKLVIIEHRSGIYSLYGHLSRLDMNKDDRVQRGQVIGLVGDTGSSRGAKLYFEIRANGEAQDPLLWLAKR
jgi:septal ring factor EnvC (AmiA/AmiB activator)